MGRRQSGCGVLLCACFALAACSGGGHDEAPATVAAAVKTNTAPLIAGTPATSVAAGATYAFTPTSGDSDGDQLTFGVDAKPPWATFDAATGRLSGTPAVTDAGLNRGIVVWVSDGSAVTALPAFDLMVTSPAATNHAPHISGTPPVSVLAGAAYAFTPSGEDDDNDPLAFTIQNRPPWASFDSSNGRLAGTPPAAGTFAGVVISVTDGSATVSLAAFDVVVTAPALNRAPSISGTPPTAVEAGNSYTFVPTAGDPDHDALTFAVLEAPPWAAFDTGTGRLSGTPPAGTAETFAGIVISVSDGALSAALPAFSIAVTAPTSNRPPVITGSAPTAAVEGTAYAFQPVATDADNDPLTYDIANAPAWAHFDKATGLLAGTPSAAHVGNYANIVISVSDGKASAALPAFAITVASSNHPPAISGLPASVVTVGQVYVFQPAASDPDHDPLTYSIGSRPPWAAFDYATGRLQGTPAGGDAGPTLPIVISVSDGPNTAALPAFSILVNRPPVITGTPAPTAAVGVPYSFKPAATDADAGSTLTFSGTNGPPWASVDSGTGELRGTPTAADAGRTYPNIVIFVSDGYTTQALPPFSITVPVPNVPPTIGGTAPLNVQVGVPYSFRPDVSDPDSATLAYAVAGAPAWLSLTGGTLHGTPGAGDVGAAGPIVISVSDGQAPPVALPAFTVTVVQPNRAPSISGTPPASVAAGAAYSFTPAAIDPDAGTTLTYTIANRPAWASFDSATGTLQGTPTASHFGTTGGIVITVSDGQLAASLGPFSIAVTNTPPVISGIAPTTVAVGTEYSFTPVATDPNPGSTLSFSINQTPSWATFDTRTGRLQGTPAAAQAGSYPDLAISVSDGELSASLPAFSITVMATNAPPVISGTAPTSVAAGAAYSFAPTASDPDPGTTLAFSINTTPAWGTFDPATGRLQGTPATANTGTTSNIVISVTDGQLSAALAPFSITVTNAPPAISGAPPAAVVAGVAYAFTPTATDPNAGTTLTYGIVNRPAWATFDPATGTLQGTPNASHIGATDGIAITVSDGLLSASLAPFSIAVTNTAPSISGTPPASVAAGEPYSFTPAASDPNPGTTLTFSITNAPAWATFDAATGALDGTPNVSHLGATNGIVITASDGHTAVSLAAFSITVTNTAPVISGAPATSVEVGAPYAFTPVASDPNPGTTLTFSINTTPPWATFDAATGKLQGTPATAHTGTTSSIVISVSDGELSTALTPFSITVINAPPVISGAPPTTVVAGAPYSFTPTASDSNAGTTLTYSIVNQPAWASFDTATGTLQGTPNASHIGTTNGIVITVTDGTASDSLAAFSITVTNTAPVISGTPATSVAVGAAYSFTPTASDANPGTTLTFSINTTPPWAALDPATGRLQGTPATAHAGVYSNLVISVSDGNASASLPAFAITVTNAAPLISGAPPTTVAAGAAYSFTPTASDPNAGTTLTFSINQTPAWATFDSTTGRLQGTPATADTGTYPNLVISVSDGRLSTALSAFAITVTNAAPAISGVPPATAIVGTPYSFTPTATDANAGTTLSFGINATPAWATFDTVTGRLQGTPSAGDVGTYGNLVITVTDGVAQTSLAPFSISVQAVATGSAQLSWTPPTQNTDGTALTDLKGYKIYWGSSLGSYPNSVVVDSPGIASYQVDGLAPGTYFFVITARNTADVESAWSNAASKIVQ
ncbi:MAG TPA: putative Ig domain-containing protein [Gammaproteobacteria bacterium]|nr:putative Ig domain-containing protein [Gammaproteobacteria bacterium]